MLWNEVNVHIYIIGHTTSRTTCSLLLQTSSCSMVCVFACLLVCWKYLQKRLKRLKCLFGGRLVWGMDSKSHVWQCTLLVPPGECNWMILLWQQSGLMSDDFTTYYWCTWWLLHQFDTHTQPFNGLWSGTTRVGRYQKKHSPTHTHPDHWTSFINFIHLHVWQSSRTTSLQVIFGLPLGLGPSTSYTMHFFTQSSSSLRSTCTYHRSKYL